MAGPSFTLTHSKRLARASPSVLIAGVHERLCAAVGGSAQLRCIVVLACVLELASADVGTIGAIAAQLERGLHITLGKIGLLVTASTLVTAITTLPSGVLVDRYDRTRVLKYGVGAWADSVEPIMAVILGTIVFREQLATSTPHLVGGLVGALFAVIGLFALARSPVVLSIYEQSEDGRKPLEKGGEHEQNAA